MPHDVPGNQADPLASNPYSTRYQQSAAPDLDAGAPQLRSHDLKRMNQRALLLLGAVVLLLLFVAYWMLSGVGSHNEQPKPREEKVTVAEPPKSLILPQPTAPAPAPQQAAAIPLVQQPPVPPMPQQPSQAAAAQPPSLVQRRIAALQGSDSANVDQPSAGPTTPVAASPIGPAGSLHDSNVTSAQPLRSPDTLMQRGTYIRCVLETRIISDIPGYASCLVTEPVYSFNGQHLLLPKGSKVLGSYDKGPVGDRVAVIWDRIITPNGIDVNMASPGIDNLGGAGLPGYYNAHWGQRIGAALLVSMLSDAFSYEAAEHGPKTATITNGAVVEQPFQSNTAQTLQNLAGQAVQASANRPATVTINQGTIIYVYVAKDVDFSGVVARF
ncbi:TrbI/VirB10 family protein [Rhodanobacter sp. 7MK24]|uniref:TrbI/VirB10 family protein n=1 Tax=Rhodanobacter sp. 7MK24 TaxID=2775922 RepID=UPI001CE138AC|nr:TrbI/VirB10 family protein [Rhodanobacter sp. 7MK24]